MGIFYPTLEKGKPSLWIQTKDYYKTLYDLAFINPLNVRWISLQFFRLFTSFMNKVTMPVQTNTRLECINPSNEHSIILLSHGLSSNMTSHSSYCCWLASQGYIVISLSHHKDLIRFTYDE
jgi:hypothetical protein